MLVLFVKHNEETGLVGTREVVQFLISVAAGQLKKRLDRAGKGSRTHVWYYIVILGTIQHVILDAEDENSEPQESRLGLSDHQHSCHYPGTSLQQRF